ncbi:hypothetical protein [Kineosporia sp. A_224]|uniref:hypothetical protein n=1 Tax=Kineosporia sp. A_224 TaxID=1962180 RepID=UPI00117B6D14|nr:hypothetical protein [Kineosporia sp. A_224]
MSAADLIAGNEKVPYLLHLSLRESGLDAQRLVEVAPLRTAGDLDALQVALVAEYDEPVLVMAFSRFDDSPRLSRRSRRALLRAARRAWTVTP